MISISRYFLLKTLVTNGSPPRLEETDESKEWFNQNTQSNCCKVVKNHCHEYFHEFAVNQKILRTP